jgi:hypothetical protein
MRRLYVDPVRRPPRKASARLPGFELCLIAVVCGGLLGAVIGAVVGATATPDFYLTRTDFAWVLGFAGLLIGGFVGLVIGMFVLVGRYILDG